MNETLSPTPWKQQPPWRRELHLILGFVALLWAICLLDYLLPLELTQFGLVPRTLWGLLGIGTMPFLHGGIGHLLSNTFPLLILLGLLAGSRSNSVEVVLLLIIATGSLLWLCGRSMSHVGASGLVYALIGYLLAAGYWERRPVSIAIALIVLFLYGGSLLWGFLPLQKYISWDGHLCGFISGLLVAYFTTRQTANNLNA